VVPTKTGVVTDALKVYDYVKERSGQAKVIVYGHSLGTAVSCEAVSSLCNAGNPPSALVLESPFNNIHDEVCWILGASAMVSCRKILFFTLNLAIFCK
jgi:abhydrolase domain-containing protein 12